VTARERLPNRRGALSFAIDSGGLRYTCTAGFFGDGRLAELFVSNHKHGSHADLTARDAAILTSLALQFGAPVDVIRAALQRDHGGRPVSPIGAALDALAGEATP
jgi:ribonucleoside-diphosphate reductase alpha chain